MLYVQFILCSLLFIAQMSLSNPSSSHSNLQNKPIEISPVSMKILFSSLETQQSQENDDSQKQKENFNEADIKEMESIFNSSPQEAQKIINHLEDPTYFPSNEDYRAAFFVGEPGTGKTMMAQAIAYKMTQKGWDCKFISSTSLLGEYRNQTSITLQKELESIQATDKPTILIIDELHRLLENANSKNHDTDSTSTTLWTFLDKQKTNNNFFLIGTMNRINKLPKPIKSRIMQDCIEFPLIINLDIKRNTLRENLTTTLTQIDQSITNDFLNQELEKIGYCSYRDLKKISNKIHRLTRINDQEKLPLLIIKKDSISQIIDDHLKQKNCIEYDIEEETDEERQNRHHKENLKTQEKHFVQQYVLQMLMHLDLHGNTIPASNHKRFMKLSLSEEQVQIYQEIFEKSYAKSEQQRAEEALLAKKAAEEKVALQAAQKEANKGKGFWGLFGF